ncbi:MAG: carbohydrate binding domain-containing protein, partial [Armatimonadetes bacterium]|nr:carbohydrate binding domain-containing protein [Armatimonadota bacterium]
APLTEKHRIVARNGHYYDASGKRVRFLATGVGAAAVFPTHDESEKMASRLHRAGINMVRLHHLDATWETPNIFYFEGGWNGAKPQLIIDARSLERFDYLVAQLKKNGIYVDLNLHIVRPWNAAMGFPDADKINPEGKAVSYFEPKAIELQRKYAREMLSHKNPYTGFTYATDPVIAIVEITNEDTLLGAADGITTLPAHYRNILQTGWNAFLKRKYKTSAGLQAAWNGVAKPLGAEMVPNGQFGTGADGFYLEHQFDTNAALSPESAAGQTNAPGGKVLHVSGIKTSGTNWHLQLHAQGLDLKEGERYTVSFAAKAAEPRKLWVNTRLDRAPWSFVGLDQYVEVGTQWKRYTMSFVARNPAPKQNRLSWSFGDTATEFYLGDVSLKSGGGGSSLPEGETIEAGNIALTNVSASPSGADFAAFLIETERRFADGMYALIKKDLGYRGTVFCSQASYGGIGGTWREANLDAVDMHSYWQHPSFPAAAFNPDNYRIENTAMVKSTGLGTLDGIATHRVAGKPFTVSEYHHPAPNEYTAETVPMMFSYAAWQDWDGIFLFVYGTTPTGKINGFFDISNHPGIMAYLPTAAGLFLRGDLAPSPQTMTLSVPVPLIPKLKAEGNDYAFYNTAGKMPDGAGFWTHRVALAFVNTKQAQPTIALAGTAPKDSPMAWDHAAGVYSVNTPQTRALVGFVGDKTQAVGDLEWQGTKAGRNFVSLTATTRDGKPLATSGAILLTVMSKAENPGLEWNAERTFAANAWKAGPVEVEGVSGTVIITTGAKGAKVYALDNDGKRKAEVPTSVASGKLTLAVSPVHRTAWYEIVPVF